MKEYTKQCPHCEYDCPKDLYEEHLRLCDKNPNGKGYREKLRYRDRFFLSPIASLILFISVVLAVSLHGTLWYLLTFVSLMWITFKKADYEAGCDIK